MFGPLGVDGVSDGTGTSFKISHPLHTEQLANSYGASSMNGLWPQPQQSGSQSAPGYSQQSSTARFRGPHLHAAQGGVTQDHPLADATASAGMFGLEPMGHSHAPSIQPLAASSIPDHYQAQFAQGMPGPQAGDANGTAGFAFPDDSLSVWTNAPMFFG